MHKYIFCEIFKIIQQVEGKIICSFKHPMGFKHLNKHSSFPELHDPCGYFHLALCNCHRTLHFLTSGKSSSRVGTPAAHIERKSARKWPPLREAICRPLYIITFKRSALEVTIPLKMLSSDIQAAHHLVESFTIFYLQGALYILQGPSPPRVSGQAPGQKARFALALHSY